MRINIPYLLKVKSENRSPRFVILFKTDFDYWGLWLDYILKKPSIKLYKSELNYVSKIIFMCVKCNMAPQFKQIKPCSKLEFLRYYPYIKKHIDFINKNKKKVLMLTYKDKVNI